MEDKLKNNLNYSNLRSVANNYVGGLSVLSSVVSHLNNFGIPILIGAIFLLGFFLLGLFLLGFFLLAVYSDSVLTSPLGSSESSSSGLALVELRHNVSVVTNDSARSVPGLVHTSAVNGADVEVGLSINTADRLEFGVAGAVLADYDLAGLGGGNLYNKN